MIFICVIYSTNRILLSHTVIPGVILCFVPVLTPPPPPLPATDSCSRDTFWTTFWISFIFLHDCWPWPIDYLIRFWSIFVVTLTFSFQGKIWNLLYLIQKWSNCHETKSKHIDWTLRLKCDHQVWPWPWPWPWIFKVKYGIRFICQKWYHCHETKSKHIAWTLGLKCDHKILPWPWPWPWSFKVKYGICYISTKSGPIAIKQKANILI